MSLAEGTRRWLSAIHAEAHRREESAAFFTAQADGYASAGDEEMAARCRVAAKRDAAEAERLLQQAVNAERSA